MSTDTTPLHAGQEALLAQLAQSRARVLAQFQAGQLNQAALHSTASNEAALALISYPVPLDPVEHLSTAHAQAHPYLERLARHDPTHRVVADETHSYTPRVILRRVLDHVLDHLNQIEQWLLWQQHGTVPTPTDGWASSDDRLPEDLQPLSETELRFWLWRLDLAVGLVVQRARQLSAEQLNWVPPDGGWMLYQALHHLASTETYYTAWLDEELSDEALPRYTEASRRFEQRMRQTLAQPAETGVALLERGSYTPTTVAHVIRQVLELEEQLLNA